MQAAKVKEKKYYKQHYSLSGEGNDNTFTVQNQLILKYIFIQNVSFAVLIFKYIIIFFLNYQYNQDK